MRTAIGLLLAMLCACSSTQPMSAGSGGPAPQAAPTKSVQAASLDASAPTAAGPFAKWTAVVIAADNHSHSGARSDAFDNARRELSSGFVAAGFAPQHVRQFSVQPDANDPSAAAYTNENTIRNTVQQLLGEAGDGCLFYFTSHGDRTGIVFDNGKLAPDELKSLIDRTCGGRPTVVVVSACYSGVFVPALTAPNQMVMTAARPDRSSFGCGDNDKYPYFDACMIEDLPSAATFPDLADRVKACVTSKETAQHFAPPSEPQVAIGPQVYTLLTQSRFKGR
jgi:hypothetical protein